jgi:ABC-type sugar transport system substrate-binding protein
MGKRAIAAVLSVLLLVVASCGPATPAKPTPAPAEPTTVSATPAAEQGKPIVVGLSWNEKGQPLVVAWEDYMKLHGEEVSKQLGRKIEWVVTVADSDPMRQNAQIEDLISQKVDIIVARAQDGAAIGSAIKAAQDAGIPFVTFDRESQSVPPNAHVGAASFDLAYQTAMEFAKLLQSKGIKGRCLELQGDMRDQNAVYFHDAWVKAEKETGAWETVVAIPTEWNPEKFRSGVVNALQAHPDCNCMFVASDFAYDAVRSGLEQAGRYIPRDKEGHIWTATIGVIGPAYQPLVDGYIDVSGMWDAWYHSQKAAEVIGRLASGEKMENQKFLVAGRIATPDNISSLDHVWARDYQQ